MALIKPSTFLTVFTSNSQPLRNVTLQRKRNLTQFIKNSKKVLLRTGMRKKKKAQMGSDNGVEALNICFLAVQYQCVEDTENDCQRA